MSLHLYEYISYFTCQIRYILKNYVETSKMELFANIVGCFQPLIIFAKRSMLGISQGRCASGKTKEKLSALSFISQKIRTAISADFLHF